MQLAGHYPKMVKVAVASRHHFGYQMTDQELLDYVEARLVVLSTNLDLKMVP